ncbi:serine protease [Salegentibacter sp. BLCTC]|uniref:S1 family peptidase n=1 Tax=Salegentibacter sp. BLCTC TaxID=2697368 RepID=UPI00187B4347|nr:serine protease [Salegentibacter sp. BLCTC]MBE7640975.1 serine protease [Salegentibacter sp. BLCTC]
MNIFTQIVVVIGKINPNGVQMLGTGSFITTDGKIVTSKHVVGQDPNNLVILAPHITNINEYQDTSDNRCQPVSTEVLEIDPIKDLCILKADIQFHGNLPKIGSFDELNIGEKIGIFSFPHCTEGRRVLTFQETEIGAKILLESNSIKSKHAVINTQARPGQSGGIIFSEKLNKIVGVLIGAYAPSQGGGISLGGINPRELHQTTHCISAEYINDMI